MFWKLLWRLSMYWESEKAFLPRWRRMGGLLFQNSRWNCWSSMSQALKDACWKLPLNHHNSRFYILELTHLIRDLYVKVGFSFRGKPALQRNSALHRQWLRIEVPCWVAINHLLFSRKQIGRKNQVAFNAVAEKITRTEYVTLITVKYSVVYPATAATGSHDCAKGGIWTVYPWNCHLARSLLFLWLEFHVEKSFLCFRCDSESKVTRFSSWQSHDV